MSLGPALSPPRRDNRGFSCNRREGCRRELRVRGGISRGGSHVPAQHAPPSTDLGPTNQRHEPQSPLPLDPVSVDFRTGCYFPDWLQTTPLSSSSQKDYSSFTLWVSNGIVPGAPGPGKGSGLGERWPRRRDGVLIVPIYQRQLASKDG